MTNFELILRKIQNWELGNARQEMSIALELGDAQIQQLDAALREYQYVADNIEAIRGELSTNPVKALRALNDLPEIKNTHPVYEKLRADAVEQVRLQQRTEVLKHIAEAEDLSQTVKSWSEARAILEDVKLSYPNWAADQEIKRNLLQAENEADKAERSDILLQEFSKQISLGKPDRGNEIVNELEILGKVIPEELKNKRQEANRIAAHKQGRSSKDTKDFSEAEDDIENEINSVERSVNSIESQANYSYRLLFNNRIRQADLYREKIIKLGNQITESKRVRDGLFDELGKGVSDIRKAEIEQDISRIDGDLESKQDALTRFEKLRKQVEDGLQEIEVNARMQIARFVDDQLEMGNNTLEDGELESATSFLEIAKNAGLPEEYEDPPDQLGAVLLNPDQQNRVNQLEVRIAEKREQRRKALEIKAKAQRQLAGESLSLSQLKNIHSELQEAQTYDKDTPGLTYALESLKNRIAQETQLQKEQYELRIEMLCQKGIVSEAQRIYQQAVETLGRVDRWQKIIYDTQKKVDHLVKVRENFQAGFRLAREALNPPGENLKSLLDEWKRDGFETALIANAEARYEEYANNVVKVREQVDLLEKGLLSNESPTKLQAPADFLQGCFLSGEKKIQALLARYWLAQANQQKDRNVVLEEDYLEDALQYADAAKDDLQSSRIKVRLNELRNQSEEGRKKQRWIEAITRYAKEDFDRALKMVTDLPANDPLRQDAHAARLIDDIEYEGRRKRAELHCGNAMEQFKHGNYDLAGNYVQQALEESPNYFEALKLDGEIRAARASEEPLLKRIQEALGFTSETNLNLSGLQVQELEDLHALVVQFKTKTSSSALAIQSFQRFTSYYQGWHEQIRQKVEFGVESARLLMHSGEFESARTALNAILELGIPSDIRSLISTFENELQNCQSQAGIVNRMIDRAVELASEGKDGIEKAILLVTIPNCPEFIRPKLDKKLEFFKWAQDEFGRILEDVTNNKAVEIRKLLEITKNLSLKRVEFIQQIDVSGNYSSELQTQAGKLRELGIKDSNQIFKAVKYLQKIVSWYANSVELVERDTWGNNFSELINRIEEQIRLGNDLKEEIPSDLPHSQVVLSAIETHVSLLRKLKHNNEIFNNTHKKINSMGRVSSPNKKYWTELRRQLNTVYDQPHVASDEEKIVNLVDLINQKEDSIRKTFVTFAASLGIIVICVLSMILTSIWSQWIGPTYFPTPTMTLTATLEPTITPTATITPLPTLAPTLTPVPLMIRVKSRSESVYNSPIENVAVDSVKRDDILKLVGYCQYGSGNYWVKVEHSYNAGVNYLGGGYVWIYIDKTYSSGNVVAVDNPKTSITYILSNYYSYLEISCLD